MHYSSILLWEMDRILAPFLHRPAGTVSLAVSSTCSQSSASYLEFASQHSRKDVRLGTDNGFVEAVQPPFAHKGEV